MEIKLPLLHFQKFRFTIEARDLLILPEYKGSTLRGGFGHSFRKVVCTMGVRPCDTCLLQNKCPYPQFFETPISGNVPYFMKGVDTGPQPFILEPPGESKRVYQKGEKLRFVLVLIGRAIAFLPYFIYTFDQLGVMGIGKAKGKFLLNEVAVLNEENNWHRIYDMESKTLRDYQFSNNNRNIPAQADSITQVTLRFLTPARIKIRGEFIHELAFREMVNNLTRRIYTLAFFHMPEAQIDWDWRPLLDQANAVAVTHSNLEWKDWIRYSNRQKSRMKMGGFMGEITYAGELNKWLPMLKLGEAVHLGKGATFGLGQYELVT